MRWPRRGILIRLAIYVPVIAFLAWRARGGCDQSGRVMEEDLLEQKLAPHRKVITLPDGTQQEIVELTAEEAEAILGHPIPRNLDAAGEAKDAKGAASDTTAGVETKAGMETKASVETKATAPKQPDAPPADAPPDAPADAVPRP